MCASVLCSHFLLGRDFVQFACFSVGIRWRSKSGVFRSLAAAFSVTNISGFDPPKVVLLVRNSPSLSSILSSCVFNWQLRIAIHDQETCRVSVARIFFRGRSTV